MKDKEIYMNDIEKALSKRGKKLPHRGQYFINNLGTLIEILGSTEQLTLTKNNESLILTIKYAVWDNEITEFRTETIKVLDDVEDFVYNYKVDIKNRFEEDVDEYEDSILSEYNKEWNKCYLPILNEYLKGKIWTSECDTIFANLIYSGDLEEELRLYLDEYLMCKYFDYDEVYWSDKECYWDDSEDYWVGCNADVVFRDIIF